MYVVIWRFEVDPAHVQEFRQHYSPDGTWAALFRGGAGYIRTELLHSFDHPAEFLTLDYWQTQEDYIRFQSISREAYANLDRRFERLTLREERIGDFIQGAS